MPSPKSRKVCPFYKEKLCFLGNECPFLHSKPQAEADKVEVDKGKDRDRERKREKKTRVEGEQRPAASVAAATAPDDLEDLKRSIEREIKKLKKEDEKGRAKVAAAVKNPVGVLGAVPKSANKVSPTQPQPPLAVDNRDLRRWEAVSLTPSSSSSSSSRGFPQPPTLLPTPTSLLPTPAAFPAAVLPAAVGGPSSSPWPVPVLPECLLPPIPPRPIGGPPPGLAAPVGHPHPAAFNLSTSMRPALPSIPQTYMTPASMPTATRPEPAPVLLPPEVAREQLMPEEIFKPTPPVPNPKAFYCHSCEKDVAQIGLGMTCPMCSGDFVEEKETAAANGMQEQETASTNAGYRPLRRPLARLPVAEAKKYFCHSCKQDIDVNPNLTCPLCLGSFLEESQTVERAEQASIHPAAEIVPNGDLRTRDVNNNNLGGGATFEEPSGFAWVPPHDLMQAFLAKEDKLKMWGVSNPYLYLDESDAVDNNFPGLDKPMPECQTVKPRKARMSSVCTTASASEGDEGADGGEVCPPDDGSKLHLNRVSRLEKRRLKKERRREVLRSRRIQEVEEAEKRTAEMRARAEERKREREMAREQKDREKSAQSQAASDAKRRLRRLLSNEF